MGLIRSINKRLLLLLLEKELPRKSELEKVCVEQMLKAIQYQKKNDSESQSAALIEWAKNEQQLMSHLQHNDIRLFLRWKVIQKTMFVNNAEYVNVELDELQRSAEWKSRWRNAIRESIVGLPPASPLSPLASGNSIHHAFHLSQFEQETKMRVEEMQTIFEFGGGYGSLCRIVHEMGFKGKYIIYDLPAFSWLQKYYLLSNKLPVANDCENNNINSGILCISDISYLLKMISSIALHDKTMFISTWALSETPELVRDRVAPGLKRFSSFLIGFQSRFGEIDNDNYFKKLTATDAYSMINWKFKPIPHISKNSYLFGAENVVT